MGNTPAPNSTTAREHALEPPVTAVGPQIDLELELATPQPSSHEPPAIHMDRHGMLADRDASLRPCFRQTLQEQILSEFCAKIMREIQGVIPAIGSGLAPTAGTVSDSKIRFFDREFSLVAPYAGQQQAAPFLIAVALSVQPFDGQFSHKTQLSSALEHLRPQWPEVRGIVLVLENSGREHVTDDTESLQAGLTRRRQNPSTCSEGTRYVVATSLQELVSLVADCMLDAASPLEQIFLPREAVTQFALTCGISERQFMTWKELNQLQGTYNARPPASEGP
jgi:hypothetical protein